MWISSRVLGCPNCSVGSILMKCYAFPSSLRPGCVYWVFSSSSCSAGYIWMKFSAAHVYVKWGLNVRPFPSFSLSTLCSGISFDEVFCTSLFCAPRLCVIWMSPVVEEELLLHVLLSRPLEQSLGISSCIPPGTRPYRTFQTTTNNTLAFFLENTLPRCITVGMCNWLCRVPWHSSLPRSLCFEVGRVGVQCSIGSTYVHISMIYVCIYIYTHI